MMGKAFYVSFSEAKCDFMRNVTSDNRNYQGKNNLAVNALIKNHKETRKNVETYITVKPSYGVNLYRGFKSRPFRYEHNKLWKEVILIHS